jgi:uncharacterized protein YbaR (Trm112 family)
VVAFKACPRCRGDLYQDAEQEIVCLQCGHELGRREHHEFVARLNARQPRPSLDAA